MMGMEMPKASEISDVYAPTAVIKVGGRPLEPAVAHRILGVSVTLRLDPPDAFSFEIYDPDLDLVQPGGGRITEGAEVEIALGYVGRTRTLILGRISAVAADFPENGPPTVRVEGFDLLHDLTRGTVHRRFEGSTPDMGLPDSQIVAKIARDIQLDPVVEDMRQRRGVRVQSHVSDLDFLHQLASANGYSLWVEGRTLHFERKRPVPSRVRLAWGRTLLSFSPRLSLAGQVESVEVRGWDHGQGESVAARATRAVAGSGLATTGRNELGRGSGGRSEKVITDEPVSSAEEARRVAERHLADLQATTTTGSGTAVGDPDLRAGSQLELTNIGRYSGTYTISEVTHTLGNGGYRASFQVNGAPGPSGLFAAPGPASSGTGAARLVPGIVTGTKDEQRGGRVRVRLPTLSDDTEHWARVATLMAGAERGSFFLPDEGDEVLVAFPRDDVGSAYVLGSLWNGRNNQPDANANGQNDRRFIKSRSGHVILLDDTGKGEKIEIVDGTGHNRITIDTVANTVTVASDKDIVLRAPKGMVRLDAERIELHSTKSTSVAADTTLSLDGTTSAKLTGKTVDIN